MLLSCLDVRLITKEDALIPHPCGYEIYAALLARLRGYSPGLSEAIHGAQVKPLSVSTLRGPGQREDGCRRIPKQRECRFRVACLNEAVHSGLAGVLLGHLASSEPLTLGPGKFRVIDVLSEPEPDRRSLGRTTSYSELVSIAEPSDEVGLRFHSPVAIRQKARNQPLPIADAVFRSIFRKWAAFSPLSLPTTPDDAFFDDLVITRAKLITRMWKMPKSLNVGSVGEVHYALAGKPSGDAQRTLAALADYAFFSAVGHRSAMGMGECSRTA